MEGTSLGGEEVWGATRPWGIGAFMHQASREGRNEQGGGLPMEYWEERRMSRRGFGRHLQLRGEVIRGGHSKGFLLSGGKIAYGEDGSKDGGAHRGPLGIEILWGAREARRERLRGGASVEEVDDALVDVTTAASEQPTLSDAGGGSRAGGGASVAGSGGGDGAVPMDTDSHTLGASTTEDTGGSVTVVDGGGGAKVITYRHPTKNAKRDGIRKKLAECLGKQEQVMFVTLLSSLEKLQFWCCLAWRGNVQIVACDAGVLSCRRGTCTRGSRRRLPSSIRCTGCLARTN